MGGDSTAALTDLNNFESIHKLVQPLKCALEQRNHKLTVHHASTAIDQIIESQLLTLLDIRAYAHASQGRFQLALVDAQRMIGYAPAEVDGYLRKAEIFSMCGRQICAIEAYDEGMNNVASDHTEMKRLSDGRDKAVAVNNRTVDFFAGFPMEIISNIVSRLPQTTNTACLMISKTWRQRVIHSSADVWRNLFVDEHHDLHSISAVPAVGYLVEHLVINTPKKRLRASCLQAIKAGYFSKIRSLKLTASACVDLRYSIVTLSNALWQARSTLTHLEIDLGVHKHTITLADILLSCSTVTDIIFSTKSSMATSAGDYSMLEKYHALTNLQLISSTIKKEHIMGVLKRCQRLRRLVMCGCDPAVLEPIDKYASNLEILSYNYAYQVPDLMHENPQPGLKVLYTNDGGTKVPFESLFPLIYKNMKILQDLQVLISSPTQLELQQLFTTYPDFKLEKVRRLIIWPHIRVQPLLMRAIREVSTLKELRVVESFETDSLIKAVMRLPALTTFEMSHTQTVTGRSSLIELFTRYAQLSATSNSLQSAILRYCDTVDDVVISSLAGVKTLENVTLSSLKNVTTAGINVFLEKTRDRLNSIALAEMASISDTSLIALSGSKSLTSVDLNNLPNLTDQAIQELIENAKDTLASVKVNNHVLVPRTT